MNEPAAGIPSIRPLRPDDIPGCLAVVAECWGREIAQIAEPEFREAFSPGAYKPVFFVAEQGTGQIIGTAFYRSSWLTYGVFEMGWLSVRPSCRRAGIGQLLVERRLDELRQIAKAALIATPIPDFFTRWGFEPLARLSGEFPRNLVSGSPDYTLMLLNFEAKAN